MKGAEVYRVLKRIGVTRLYHANSVTTSCTFLEQGGLLSRGFVEGRRLQQTAQVSDAADKRYGIWHSIFLDHIDIHVRAKSPNLYGPVLVIFGLEILLGLPGGTRVLVTKSNPIHWQDNQADGVRWFPSTDELAKNIRYGNFDKIVVIQTPSEKLDFPDQRAAILLDDPKRRITSGEDAFTYAKNRLEAAAAGRVEALVERRKCPSSCNCVREYGTYTRKKVDFLFT